MAGMFVSGLNTNGHDVQGQYTENVNFQFILILVIR